jgi:hypothetical protein
MLKMCTPISNKRTPQNTLTSKKKKPKWPSSLKNSNASRDSRESLNSNRDSNRIVRIMIWCLRRVRGPSLCCSIHRLWSSKTMWRIW